MKKEDKEELIEIIGEQFYPLIWFIMMLASFQMFLQSWLYSSDIMFKFWSFNTIMLALGIWIILWQPIHRDILLHGYLKQREKRKLYILRRMKKNEVEDL